MKKLQKTKISDRQETGPGLAGHFEMPGRKNHKSTTEVSPAQLVMIQKHLIEKTKQKQPLSQQPTMKQKEQLRFDSTKTLTIDTEGEKYLILHRTDENKSMRDFSPILLETVIKNVTNNGTTESKFLKSGDLLIKTQNVKQAKNLIKLTGIFDATIEVTEHKTKNSCKGVISAYELKNEDSETLLNYLHTQNVIEVKMHQKTINGQTFNTGLVFITFGVNTLPEYLTVGLLRVRVRPYIPTPMRCFSCHKYGHTSKYCSTKDNPKCYNCNNDKHLQNKEDKCTNQPVCVNCNEIGHNSYNRNCKEYKRQVDIQTIKVTQNVSLAEAVKRSNLQRKTYAQVTTAETENTCKCQHCSYHNKNTTTMNNKNSETIANNPQEMSSNSNKRLRVQKASSHELSTDEESMKKIKMIITEHEDEEEDMHMIT